ncbi:MAG: ADOP family duplicated permease, partial [Gemmatimonadetes bacterium]|nr:ADOP family duplicated permease [Gemmatimonadota bacterium]
MRAFPRDFRREFGDGVLDTAYSAYAEARRRGRPRALVLLAATAWDLVKTGLKERVRPSWKPPIVPQRKREVGTMLEQLFRDLAYATRSLIRSPGFTLVTLVTLSLAIGSNVAIFSVVDAVLLDPLPYANPDRLVAIRASAPGSDFPEEFNVSIEFYVQYREQAGLLEDIGAYSGFGATLRTDQFAERSRMAIATHTFFTTLGVTPVLGRLPRPDDDDDVVVISHTLWTTRFGADSSIIGRSLEIAEETRTVIGVMGPELRKPEEATAIWIPYRVDLSEIAPGNFFWGLVGRMKPGIDADDLAAQLAPLAARLPERFGGSANYARLIEQHRPVVRPLKADIVGDVARPLWVLLGTMGVVLMIACANVANLFLVRAEGRHRDLAVRQALGATRGRLVQSQMAEAMLLAGMGGAAGVLLARVGVPFLLNAAPDRVPRMDAVGIDATGLLFTGAVAVATAIIFGLVPAIRSAAVSLADSLRSAGRGTPGRSKHVGRDALVVLQTALALVLLVGSGLLVRSFRELRDVNPGYDTENIFTFQVAPTGNIQDGPTLARFHYGLMERLAALPGVESVGVVRELPLDEGTPARTFVTEDLHEAGETSPFTNYTFTGGDYFQTMQIALLSGRYFTRADHETNHGNAIVSRSAAESFWPGENPLGKRLRFASDSSGWETVVGVVEDIHQHDFRRSDDELIYFP